MTVRERSRLFTLLFTTGVMVGCSGDADTGFLTGPTQPKGVQSATIANRALPAYMVRLLGGAYARAINQNGDAAGWMISGTQRAWASFAGGSAVILPLPAWATASRAEDINESGVVVGCASSATVGDAAIAWTPSGGGYTISELGMLPGMGGSCATGINNVGDIVGYSITPGWMGGPATLFTGPGGLVDLGALGFSAQPAAINDQRQLIAGHIRMDLDDNSIVDLATTTSGGLNSINELGEGAGTIRQGCCVNPPSNLHVARFTNAGGWEILSGSGRYNYGYGINDAGDVSGEAAHTCGSGSASLTAVVYLEGLGLYCLWDLLAPGDRDWILSSVFTNDINNAGQIALTGSNSVTGEFGAVILTPAGALPPPGPVTGLTAVSHPPTTQQPWNAITLDWDDPGSLDIGFRIERRVSGTTAWSEIDQTTINTSYWDTSVALGVTYDYRIIAFGLAGDAPPSNTATATAPGTPVDTEAPVVAITSPVDGATVSRRVRVEIDASDNVGLTSVDLIVRSNSSGPLSICGTTLQGVPSTSTRCTWNTRRLPNGIYRLEARATDAIGNTGRHEISVQIGSTNSTMRSASVDLSARVKRGKVDVTGAVTVLDGSGSAVKSASVYAEWSPPGGTVQPTHAYTDRKGVAKFNVSGGSGTYTLTITNIVKTGYTFDSGNSVLSGSISR